MLNQKDKHYIQKTIDQSIDHAIRKQDQRSRKRDEHLDKKIEDLRSDMADEFLRNRQEHIEIRQELKDFKNKTLNMLDQILDELKAMRENYAICSYHREENTAVVVQLDHRLTRVETRLGIEDVE